MWQTIIIEPLTNTLVILTNLSGGSFGFGVILLTIATKLVLLPFSLKATKSQILQKELQPEIEALKKKHPDKTEQAKKVMEFYKERGANPFSGCLPILIQLPLLFGIYQVFYKGLENVQSALYTGISVSEMTHYTFIGTNLLEKSIVLAVLAGAFQFAQVRLSPTFSNQSNSEDITSKMTKNMTYFLPVMIAVVSLSLPSAMALYFIINSITSIIQDYIYIRAINKPKTV